MVRFRVLGTFEMVNGERICTPTAPKVRRVLAHLLMHANQVVHIDSMIEELWGERPPASAVTTTQTYIYQLRKLINRENLSETGKELLVTKPPGYLLQIRPDQLDAEKFTRLVADGRSLLDADSVPQGVRSLHEALALWTGPALSNVTLGSRLEAWAVQLEEQRLRALELRIEGDFRLGRHREVIGDLRSLVMSHPLNEWFHARLIWALSRCGRRSEALQAYRSLRALLSQELGLEPSPELQRLHHQVLTTGTPATLRLASTPA